ncbi:hypothetical protein C0J52_03361 [Blattella germanica]|nr:hypothetical protein C0J52_03361 [Blattella germanica]
MNWPSIKLLKVFVTLLSSLIGIYDTERDILVQTQQGLIRGTTLTSQRNNRSFFVFMGIPYAKPPVGNLRFKAPQPPESWSGIRDATLEGSICPQGYKLTSTIVGEEDCLFLNVYTEKLPTNQNRTLRPVMFYIHTGVLWYGSGTREYQGPDFLMDHGVVVVTINFRLGFLGFLSLQSAEVPGNNGLKDQVMALRWVQQNIAQFGGDPDNITIFGGMSVSLLMLSPMSQGLFHKAIAQSDSALNYWRISTSEKWIRQAKDVARQLNINTDDTEVLWQALVNTSFHDLSPVITFDRLFSATVDTMAPEGEVFLPDTPRNIINSGQVRNIPLLTGLSSSQLIFGSPDSVDNLSKSKRKIFDSIIAEAVDMNMETSSEDEALKEIKMFYFGNVDIKEAMRRLVADMIFINVIYCNVRKHAELSTSPVYVYDFSFTGSKNMFTEIPNSRTLADGDVLAYIFLTTFHNLSLVPNTLEHITSERMVTMWTNFAKYGNPTPEAHHLLQNVTWTPVTATNFSSLNIDQNLTVEYDTRRDSLNFWENIYRNYTSHSILKLLNMLVALLSNFKGNHDTERDILVQTHQGLIRGTTLRSQRSNRSFFAFMGIPYAKPPVGNLRFKAPQPPEKWSGIKNTTIEGSVCPQVNKFTDTFEGQVRDTFEGQEDCLFLNVYTEKSGPILNSWKISTSEECIRHAMDAAKDMGITATDTKVLWKALVNASFHDLIPIIRKKTEFIPTVDAMAPEGEVFLPDTPRNMLNAGEFRNVPFLAGLTSNEGIITC